MSWANGNPDKNFNALAELQAGENRRTKGVERSTKRSRKLLSDWCPGATLKNKHTHTYMLFARTSESSQSHDTCIYLRLSTLRFLSLELG